MLACETRDAHARRLRCAKFGCTLLLAEGSPGSLAGINHCEHTNHAISMLMALTLSD